MRALRYATLLLAVLSWGCEHADPFTGPPGGVEPKLSSIQAFVFDRKCAVPTCHVTGTAALGLVLSAGESYGNLVGVPSGQVALNRVEPNDPDNSYLVRKLEGAVGIGGEQMPRNAAPLPPAEVQAIRDWITNGAPND